MGEILEEIGKQLVLEACQHPMTTLATVGKITTIAAPVVIPLAVGGAIGLVVAKGIDVLTDHLIGNNAPTNSFKENDALTNSFEGKDNIYIFNKSLYTVYVAIHHKVNQNWNTKYWVKVPSNEKVFVLSEKLESKYIYCCGRTLDSSAYWGKGDYNETLDESLYKFTEFDTGTSRGDYVITYTA